MISAAFMISSFLGLRMVMFQLYGVYSLPHSAYNADAGVHSQELRNSVIVGGRAASGLEDSRIPEGIPKIVSNFC